MRDLASRPAARDVGPAAMTAAAVVLMALIGAGPWLLPALLGVIAVVASVLLARFAQGIVGPWWIVPALAAAGILVGRSSWSLGSAAVAALLGLSLLNWAARGASRPARGAPAWTGLVVPGLTTAVALVVALVLPTGPSEAAVAVLVLVVVFLALGWSLGTGARASTGPPAGS